MTSAESGRPAPSSGVAVPAAPFAQPPPPRLLVGASAQRTSVDGVTTFVAPASGSTQASLSFRVGSSDEPLPVRGITALVAHLATNAVGIEHVLSPPTVSASITTFHFDGSGQQVANEIGALCHWLSSAHDSASINERLIDKHRSTLDRSVARHAPEHMNLLRARLGPSGWASGSINHIGVPSLDPERLANWAKRYFVAENAVLALSGTKSTTLRVPLPAGSAQPIGELNARSLSLPGFRGEPRTSVQSGGLITLEAGHGDRGRIAASLATDVFKAHAARALRERTGSRGTIEVSSLAIGTDHVHLALAAQHDTLDTGTVTATVLDAIGSLGTEDLSDEELGAYVRRRLDAFDKVTSIRSGRHRMLERQAIGGLTEAPWSVALERRLLHSISAAHIRAIAQEFTGSMIVIGPTRPAGFTTLGTTMQLPVAPTRFRSRPAFGVLARNRYPAPQPRRVLIDDTALTIRSLDRPDIQVPWSEVSAMSTHDDGHRTLIGEHCTVEVCPEQWHDPAALITAIDAHVGDDRVAELGPRTTPPAPKTTLTDRVPIWSWPLLLAISAALIALSLLPIWGSSPAWVHWIIGTVGLIALVVVGAFGFDVAISERRLRRPGRVRGS